MAPRAIPAAGKDWQLNSTVERHLDVKVRKPVPRGLLHSGPAILHYGFRPFFLGAGVFAVLAMAIWIGALTSGWEVGGSMGAIDWHAHEMLFGYTSAAMAGFLLTAIPNWTGRLPVAGKPLLGLFALWLAGRLVMLAPDVLGAVPSAIVDAAFLPTLFALAAREVIAGRNWKNLRVVGIGLLLAAANIAFHLTVRTEAGPAVVLRLTVSAYVVLIAVIGGRIVPSFTRNWLVKAGVRKLPSPMGLADHLAIGALVAALLLWTVAPQGPVTAGLAAVAAVLQAFRLWRWRGWTSFGEPLLVVLHLAYAFIPLGLGGIALAATTSISQASVLHLLTVGAIGNMTLAVMTRASLGHTGRPLHASLLTALSYLALLIAALMRPLAELLAGSYLLLLSISAACWLAAFLAFVVEYGPMLMSPKRGAHRTGTA